MEYNENSNNKNRKNQNQRKFIKIYIEEQYLKLGISFIFLTNMSNDQRVYTYVIELVLLIKIRAMSVKHDRP